MRLSELYGAEVRTEAGETLGRVREVHCNEERVTQLGIGAGSWISRMTGGGGGRRIRWEDVTRADPGNLVVRG